MGPGSLASWRYQPPLLMFSNISTTSSQYWFQILLKATDVGTTLTFCWSFVAQPTGTCSAERLYLIDKEKTSDDVNQKPTLSTEVTNKSRVPFVTIYQHLDSRISCRIMEVSVLFTWRQASPPVNSLVQLVFVYMTRGPAVLSEISPRRAQNFPYKHTQKRWSCCCRCVLDLALLDGPENSRVKAR